MQNQPYVLIVTLEAKPGQEQALKALLNSMVPPSRNESGCIEYRLHETDEHPGKFMFYEIWQNKAAHAAHTAMPHMAEWHARKADLVAAGSKSYWQPC